MGTAWIGDRMSYWLCSAFAAILVSAPAFGLSSLNLRPGVADEEGFLSVDVVLDTDDTVGGFQGDIHFDNTILALEARDCRINPEIGLFPLGSPPNVSCLDDTSIGPCKNLSSVRNQCGGSPQAEGCPDHAPDTVSVFRAIVVATAAPNNNVLPSGVVYSCRFRVLDATRLRSRFLMDNVVFSDPFGTRLGARPSEIACGIPEGCPPVGCYGSLDCESSRCEAASGGGYPGSCAAGPIPKPTFTATVTATARPPTPTATATATAAPLPDGKTCFSGSVCISRQCVDGVCCSEPSCPPGEFCNLARSPGRCAVRVGIGEGCTGDNDCASMYCDAGAGNVCAIRPPTPSPVPRTPTRTFAAPSGTPCAGDATTCHSRYCVNDVCCVDAACTGSNRCDIIGNEGRCVPPLPEGSGCNTNSDCSPGLACVADGFGARRCTIVRSTSTFIPRQTPTALPPSAPEPTPDAADNSSGSSDDDGCRMSARPSGRGVLWPLGIAVLFVLARSNRRKPFERP